MHVLVTGASGFIGHNVLLRAPGTWDVTAVYHQTPGLEEFARASQLHNVRAVRCNLVDPGDVRSMANALGNRVDAVLYLAANGDPAVSTARPRQDLEQNTVALVTLLEHLASDHFVYVSSGAVYDGLVGPVTPETPVSPRLPYAISKLASEQYVRFFCERRRTIGSYINVRFFGAYGPYEAERKITTRWLQAMADGQREFVIRGDGKNLIDFMYVDDAVDGFLALAGARGTSATVDFASGAPVPVNDVVHAMARLLNIDVRIRHEATVPEYIEFRSVDSTMHDRFGVTPTISLEDGIRRLHAFLAQRATRA